MAAEQKEKERPMSEQTKPEANPDDLTKTTEPNSIELTEKDLKRVSGGALFDAFLKLDGIKGE